MDAGELRLTDIPRRHGGFLAVSQSGETRDLMKALKHAELAGVARMSVVNAVGSAIARETVNRRGIFSYAFSCFSVFVTCVAGLAFTPSVLSADLCCWRCLVVRYCLGSSRCLGVLRHLLFGHKVLLSSGLQSLSHCSR